MGGEERAAAGAMPMPVVCSVICPAEQGRYAQGLSALKTTHTNNLSTHGVRSSGRGTVLKSVAIHFPQDHRSIVGGGASGHAVLTHYTDHMQRQGIATSLLVQMES